MVKRISVLLAALSIFGAVQAQDITLTVGDKAPALKLDGWAKGSPVNAFKSGEVYVVEFWATWCGPCISAMPHLSDMADSFKGKATFISVNTWDYNGANGKESSADHQKRVNDWIAKNNDKMRYNIAFDTAADDTSTTWMRAAGRNGIPCAFIVNQEGNIAWIGHPMSSMDKVLEQVHAKTWDLAAFKATFQAEQNKIIEANKNKALVTAAAKANDMAAFEALIGKVTLADAISTSITANPDFAISVLEKYAGKVKEFQAYTYCSMAATIAQRSTKEETKARAVKLSDDCFKMVDEKVAAIGAIYHARVLFFSGNKADALKWADKATALLESYQPETGRASVKKFIETSVALFNK